MIAAAVFVRFMIVMHLLGSALWLLGLLQGRSYRICFTQIAAIGSLIQAAGASS
jgi:hypothetical protein